MLIKKLQLFYQKVIPERLLPTLPYIILNMGCASSRQGQHEFFKVDDRVLAIKRQHIRQIQNPTQATWNTPSMVPSGRRESSLQLRKYRSGQRKVTTRCPGFIGHSLVTDFIRALAAAVLATLSRLINRAATASML